jgi:hypothetical protein
VTVSIARRDALVTLESGYAVFVRTNFESINPGQGHEKNNGGMHGRIGFVRDTWSDEHDSICG